MHEKWLKPERHASARVSASRSRRKLLVSDRLLPIMHIEMNEKCKIKNAKGRREACSRVFHFAFYIFHFAFLIAELFGEHALNDEEMCHDSRFVALKFVGGGFDALEV